MPGYSLHVSDNDNPAVLISFKFMPRVFCVACQICMYALQDEVKALGRLNVAYFLVGFLGFLTTWILDMIYMFLHKEAVLRPNQLIKGLFGTCAPHYLLSRCLYDISQTYQEASGKPNADPFTYAVTGRVFIILCLQAAGMRQKLFLRLTFRLSCKNTAFERR